MSTTQLTAMNFVGYSIRTEFASDKGRKLTIIACPLKGTFWLMKGKLYIWVAP